MSFYQTIIDDFFIKDTLIDTWEHAYHVPWTMRTTHSVTIHSTVSKIDSSIRVYDKIGHRLSVIHNQRIDTTGIHSPNWQILHVQTPGLTRNEQYANQLSRM